MRRERSGVSTVSSVEQGVGLDRRLNLVQSAWRQFEMQHPELNRLSELDTATAVALANQAGATTAEALFRRNHESYDGTLRQVTIDDTNKFVNAIIGPGNRYIAARHGMEKPPAYLSTPGVDQAAQKRQMMQLPNNSDDPAKPQSLPEAVSEAIILKYAAEKSGKKLRLRSTSFFRGEQVARVFEIVTGVPLAVDPRLNSLCYKDASDGMSDEALAEGLPQGTIPWEENTINMYGKLIPPTQEGRSVYEELIARETQLMDEALEAPGDNTVTVDVTHTQHHVIAAGRAGYADPKLRLTELGMLVFAKRVSEGGGETPGILLAEDNMPFTGILSKETVLYSDLLAA